MREALTCFPLRSDWERTQPAKREEYPAPLVTSKEPFPGLPSWPTAALKLAESAREASWKVIRGYSRGCFPHARTGHPGGLKEVVSLRFGRHPMTDRQAYAVYSRGMTPAGRAQGAWTWSSIMIWGPDLPPYAGCGITELKQYLSAVDQSAAVLAFWVRGLKDAAAVTEAARKRRASTRAQIVKRAQEGRFEAARQENRVDWYQVDAAWRAKVADLADGVFTSEEVARMIEPKVTQGGMR